MANDIHCPPLVYLLSQTVGKSLTRERFPAAVGLNQLGPCLTLSLLDEREEFNRVEAELAVKVLSFFPPGPDLANQVTALRHQVVGDLHLKERLTD